MYNKFIMNSHNEHPDLMAHAAWALAAYQARPRQLVESGAGPFLAGVSGWSERQLIACFG